MLQQVTQLVCRLSVSLTPRRASPHGARRHGSSGLCVYTLTSNMVPHINHISHLSNIITSIKRPSRAQDRPTRTVHPFLHVRTPPALRRVTLRSGQCTPRSTMPGRPVSRSQSLLQGPAARYTYNLETAPPLALGPFILPHGMAATKRFVTTRSAHPRPPSDERREFRPSLSRRKSSTAWRARCACTAPASPTAGRVVLATPRGLRRAGASSPSRVLA